MRKQYVLTLLIALGQTLAFGQTESRPRRWHFGVMTGAQITQYIPKSLDVDATKAWWSGADIGYRFQDSPKGFSVHLQPNLSLSRFKTESGVEGSDYYMKYEWKYRTISLPLLVRYTFTDGKFRPFAELGGDWAIRSRYKVGSSGMICRDGGCYPMEFSESTGKSDSNPLRALASVGVQIDAGKVTIPITVRVVQSLKKAEEFFDPFSGTTFVTPKIRGIQLTAGIVF